MPLGEKKLEALKIIYNLFNWTIAASVVGSIMVLNTLALKFIAKKESRLHYLLWLILVLRLLIPAAPESTFPVASYLLQPLNKALQINPISRENADLTGITALEAPLAASEGNQQNVLQNVNRETLMDSEFTKYISFMLPLVWFVGMVLIAAVLFFSNLKFRVKMKREPEVDDKTIQQIASECKNILRIKKNPGLKLTEELKTPALFGILKPVVLLPTDLLHKIDLQQLKHILLHEFSHYKRKDFFLNGLILCLKAVHWFNPVIWYGFAKMRQDCELACDARVLSELKPRERTAYGYTIIHLLKVCVHAPKMRQGLIGISANKYMIRQRVQSIAEFRAEPRSWAFVGVGIIALLSYAAVPGGKDFVPRLNAANTYAAIFPEQSGDDLTTADSGVPGRQPASKTGIIIEDIQGQGFEGKVMLIEDPKRIKLAVTNELGVTGERLSDMVKEVGAIAGINAGGFYDPGGKGNGAFPDGLTMTGGKIVHNNVGDAAVNIVGFNADGKLVLGQMNARQLLEETMQEAVTFEPYLLVDGKPMIQGDGGWGIAPRTGIGQKADGTVIFVVIDGRQPTWSIGATLRDLMNLFIDYGAVNAANLDGGSSSELVYDGKVMNKLWNIFGERYIPTAFVVR